MESLVDWNLFCFWLRTDRSLIIDHKFRWCLEPALRPLFIFSTNWLSVHINRHIFILDIIIVLLQAHRLSQISRLHLGRLQLLSLWIFWSGLRNHSYFNWFWLEYHRLCCRNGFWSDWWIVYSNLLLSFRIGHSRNDIWLICISFGKFIFDVFLV